jgi:hypothetical protein
MNKRIVDIGSISIGDYNIMWDANDEHNDHLIVRSPLGGVRICGGDMETVLSVLFINRGIIHE